ncbi:MAG: deaminase [Chitinophagaceae bacterium]|nr:MAG: deaminase [Chitinophagaceae bacterium]
MRKVILKMQLSLDGIVSGEGDWMSFSDSIVSDAMKYYETLDTIIVGSKFYTFLSDYWQAAEKSSSSLIEKNFASRMNAIDKIVLSRTPVNLTWKNSRCVNFNNTEDLMAIIRQLKNTPGKDISVESGIGMWKLFLRHNIFDALLLYVHPIIAGNGIRLFETVQARAALTLKESKTLDRGVIKLFYEITDRQ